MPAPVPVSHRGPQRTQCSTNMESRESLVPNWEELWQHHGYYDGYFFSPRLCRTPFGYQTGISGPCTASSHFWAMHSNISLPEVSTYPPSEKVTFSQLHSPTLIMNQQPHPPYTHTQGSLSSFFLIQSFSSKAPLYLCSDSLCPTGALCSPIKHWAAVSEFLGENKIVFPY